MAASLAFVLAVAVSAAFLGRQVFPVKPLAELLLGGFPHGLHFTFEIQCLSGHGVIEVHGHGVFRDGCDCTLYHLALGIEHGEGASHHKQFLADFTVNFECLQGQADQIIGIVGSVSFFGSQGEGEFIPLLLSMHRSLEFGQEHAGSVNILKRSITASLVGDASFNFEFVAQCHYIILLNFH